MNFFNDVERNDTQLSHLRTALAQLSNSIPLGNSIEHYAPDPDKVEPYGSTEATLNNLNALEVTFAPRTSRYESTCW